MSDNLYFGDDRKLERVNLPLSAKMLAAIRKRARRNRRTYTDELRYLLLRGMESNSTDVYERLDELERIIATLLRGNRASPSINRESTAWLTVLDGGREASSGGQAVSNFYQPILHYELNQDTRFLYKYDGDTNLHCMMADLHTYAALPSVFDFVRGPARDRLVAAARQAQDTGEIACAHLWMHSMRWEGPCEFRCVRLKAHADASLDMRVYRNAPPPDSR